MASGLTVGGAVHDNEASINVGSLITMFEGNSISMASKSVLRFVEMDFMVGAFESPQSCDASTTTADNSHPLSSLHFEWYSTSNERQNTSGYHECIKVTK